MKKIISLFLTALMLLTCFTGCEDKKTSRDTSPGVVTILALSEMRYFMNDFELYVNKVYPDIEIKFEYLTASRFSDEVEYKTQIQQLRTEIMAGRGPDIFLLPTGEFGYSSDDGDEEAYFEPLFADINEAMQNKVFLPVDEYLADAKHYRPENYPAAVMDAGKTAEGQCVFPLLYTYYVVLLDKTQMAAPEFTYSSLEDILTCGDEKVVDAFSAVGQQMASMYLTELADYEIGKLTVTEEDLRKVFEFATMNPSSAKSIELLHSAYGFTINEMCYTQTLIYEYYEDIAYPMYMPNQEGGITATIETFAAINANTDTPESSFKILELFYSDAVQLEQPYNEYGSYLYGFNSYISQSNMGGISVDYNTISKESTRNMVKELGAKINCARFKSDLEVVIDGYVRNSLHMYFEKDPVDYSKECLKDLKMVLEE